MNAIDRALTWNTIIQLFGKVLTTALGFLSVALLTRHLGPEKFGWYVSAVTILQFVAIIADFGMIPLSAQMLSQAGNAFEATWRNLLGFRIATACLILLPAPLLSLLFPYPPEVRLATFLLSFSFIAIAIAQVCIGFLQHKLALHHYALADTTGRLLVVMGTVYGILFHMSFLSLVGIISLGSVATTVYLLIAVSRYITIRPAYNALLWKTIAIAMWPIAVAIMFNVIYLKGDTIILSWYAPQTNIGLYGAAYRVIDILTQTAMMLMGMMLPLFTTAWVNNDKTQFQTHHERAWHLMMLFAFPSILGGIILAKPIMQLVGGPQFTPAAPLLQILLIAVFGVFLGAIYGHMAVAIGKQKNTLPIYITSSIITLIGYLIFIPIYGAYGAAWMTVCSEFITGIGLFFALRHYSKSRVPMRTTALLLFSSIVMASALYPLQNASLLFTLPLGVIIYAIFVIGLRIIPLDTIVTLFKKNTASSISETHEL